MFEPDNWEWNEGNKKKKKKEGILEFKSGNS